MGRFNQASKNLKESVRSAGRQRSIGDIQDELDEVTTLYYTEYLAYNEAEKRKKALRQQFFNLVTEYVSLTPQPQKFVTTPEDETDPEGWIAKDYPGWKILDTAEDGFLLERDPSKTPFSYHNPHMDLVFTRQVAEVGSYFDTDAFRTAGAWTEGLLQSKTIVVTTLDEDKAEEYMRLHPESQEIFVKHSHPGKIQLSFPAPRRPKEEA